MQKGKWEALRETGGQCLRASWSANLFEARRKIAEWRNEHNEEKPHGSLKYGAPEEFAREQSCGIDGGFAPLENAPGFPLSHSHGGDGVSTNDAASNPRCRSMTGAEVGGSQSLASVGIRLPISQQHSKKHRGGVEKESHVGQISICFGEHFARRARDLKIRTDFGVSKRGSRVAASNPDVVVCPVRNWGACHSFASSPAERIISAMQCFTDSVRLMRSQK